jgi:hypothetical protein
VDPGDPTSQVTAIDAGNIPDDLFWTIAIDTDGLDFDFQKGTASMSAQDVDLRDFGTLLNDFMHGDSIAASASFAVRWSDAGKPFQVRDEKNGFVGGYRETTATIEYTASNEDGFQYESDPAETSHTEYAAIGHERNGVFFR